MTSPGSPAPTCWIAATPVITHASVDLRVGEAVELIAALRSGFRWSLNEFKSGQFLRGPQCG